MAYNLQDERPYHQDCSGHNKRLRRPSDHSGASPQAGQDKNERALAIQRFCPLSI